MRILFVTPYLPGPPIFGGQRRIHGLMSELAREHDLSVVALVDASEDHAPGISDTRKYCRHVVAVPDHWHRVTGRKKRLLQVRSLVSRKSWERMLYLRPAFQKALDRHLAENEYDVITCEFVFMAAFRFRTKGWRRRPLFVLDEHNVEYDILRRTASASSLDRRLFNEVNWRKLRREEVRAWKRFDGCSVTSRRDEQIVREEAPRARTAVVPNGVDVDGFRPAPERADTPMTALFFGAINYYPNTDGALLFAREIFPLLATRFPKLEFRIVGPVGEGPVMDLASDRIRVVGFVDDVRTEIARATLVVAPLRIGGGTRLKILEAMAMGKPIVSTRIGAEGLDVTHEQDILLADEPRAFAEQVGRVLDDRALASRLGLAARRTVEALYSWRASAEKLDAFYRELARAP